MENKEVIDGVTVVHTGVIGEFGYKDGTVSREVIEMYDCNGNRLYMDCGSLEQAEELVEYLKKEGKKAVIGPKAPYIIDGYGNNVKNEYYGHVGVYIVEELEEEMIPDSEKKGKSR